MQALAQETDRLLRLAGSSGEGADTEGRRFLSVCELWAANFDDASAANIAAVADDDEAEEEEAWYSNAAGFWNDPEHCPASDDGVLGGFAHVSPVDVRETLAFIDALRLLRPCWRRAAALDCAAGIGRVAKHALLARFNRVDLLEQSKRLLDASVAYVECGEGDADADADDDAAAAALPPPVAANAAGEQLYDCENDDCAFYGTFAQVAKHETTCLAGSGTGNATAPADEQCASEDAAAPQEAMAGASDGSMFEAAAAAPVDATGRVGRRIHCGMQEVSLITDSARWDLIWVQWAIGHLTDVDMIDFLQHCRTMLSPGGLICIKENVMAVGNEDAFTMDTEDSSLTRSLEYYRCVFQQSGMSVISEVQQDVDDWPIDLLPVYMWALA